MARIVDHLSVAALEARYRAAREATEARHTQAIWPLAQGRTVLEVAEVLAFAPRWVEELAARYNAQGPEALGDQRRRNGRAASLLTGDVLAALAERVRTPPDDGGLWSGAEVAAWMARHLGLATVHPQRGWEALRRIDWSIQAPRPRHPRAATPEQRATFKGGSTPLSPRPGRRTPAGRSRSGRRTVGRTASDPPGPEADPPPRLGTQRPAPHRPRPPPLPVAPPRRLRAADQRRGGLVSLQRPLQALLRRTARHLRPRDRTGAGRERSIVLVLDNAGWHGPEGLVVPDGISLVFLPPYSPELQPAEHLWPLVDEPVANRHFATLADLEAVVAERCRRLEAAALQPHTDLHWWPRPATRN